MQAILYISRNFK